jgi:hypothetical protein
LTGLFVEADRDIFDDEEEDTSSLGGSGSGGVAGHLRAAGTYPSNNSTLLFGAWIVSGIQSRTV